SADLAALYDLASLGGMICEFYESGPAGDSVNVAVVKDQTGTYLVLLNRTGEAIPAGEYAVAVNYLASNPRDGSAYVEEDFVTGTVDGPQANGTFVPIDVSVYSDVVAYTPIYSVGETSYRGLTACVQS
ncbi:MAG: hypothetical protein IJ856_02035, partial [Candidatus Methanomethylophilaceae archaeon]|nr:hypothetical protein [Candidatus Methanomethylophilaceae archaeon]